MPAYYIGEHTVTSVTVFNDYLAKVVPMIERERTVTPLTTPRAWTIWCPSSVKVVLVISGPIASSSMEWSLAGTASS